VHQVDVRDHERLTPIVAGCRGVVHLAAIVGDLACQKEPEIARAVNLDASKRLYQLANAAGCARFVFASTCSNYGCLSGDGDVATEQTVLAPLSLYATTKVETEQFLLGQPRANTCKAVCLRFATAYGTSPRMRFDLTVSDFVRTLRSGEELVVFGDSTWRPYCHIEDLSAAVALALAGADADVAFDVFNVGHTDENYTKRMVVEEIVKRIPGGRVTYQSGAARDLRNYRVDFTKIRDRLGFEPRWRVPQGIDEVIDALDRGSFGDGRAPRYYNA
jgi:nucleoside-diphosphate-sugar epimerase